MDILKLKITLFLVGCFHKGDRDEEGQDRD